MRRLSTAEACAYLKTSRQMLLNYEAQGRLHPTRDGTSQLSRKYFMQEELEAIRTGPRKTEAKAGGRPRNRALRERAEATLDRALEITAEGGAIETIPLEASPRQMVEAFQRRIGTLALKYHALEIIAADLESPSWKCRHDAAHLLLDKIIPNVKSVEITRTTDPDTAHRHERAVKVLEEIAAQGRLRKSEHSVRILEAEDAKVV